MTHVKIESHDFERSADGAAAEFNAALIGGLEQAGWRFPPESPGALRAAFPTFSLEAYTSPRAENLRIPTPVGGVDVRVFPAENPGALFVHAHAGGWTIGSAAGQDARLEHIAAVTGMTVLSVEYRLAPEHPHPAGLDDCEAVLRWALSDGAQHFGTGRVLVGGESSGANLALSALLRVNRTDPGRIAAASLLYGMFDCAGTPSLRLARDGDAMITSTAMDWFLEGYVPGDVSQRDPEVSPLYADLAGLPPVLVSVGARDSLVDDSVFLATRLVAAGVECRLQLVPGAEHGFDGAPFAEAVEAVKVIDEFLGQHAGGPTR